jgi:hypothetical protein
LGSALVMTEATVRQRLSHDLLSRTSAILAARAGTAGSAGSSWSAW